jgi:hypothetical protein
MRRGIFERDVVSRIVFLMQIGWAGAIGVGATVSSIRDRTSSPDLSGAQHARTIIPMRSGFSAPLSSGGATHSVTHPQIGETFVRGELDQLDRRLAQFRILVDQLSP